MKKIVCLVLVILFTVSVTAAYAGKSACSAGAAKEGSKWTQAYTDISCWGWGKKSSKSADAAAKAAPKEAPQKRGTEVSTKN